MKRLFNLILACLLIVSLSACGKQAETENDMTGGQEQQTQGGGNTVTGDISFNFETKTVLLNSGYEMPIYGIGTYSLTGDTCVESVTVALNNGVRLIDTAYMYHNEKSVGEAVRNSDIPREEIFVITKLYPNQFDHPEAAIEEALAKLDIDYIDMMLLHHPGTGDVEAYLAMEKAVADGKIRSLGLSNWYVEELRGIYTADKHYACVGSERNTPLLSGKRCNSIHSWSWDCGARVVSAWRQGIYGRAAW